ncbi:MAG: hypothetical protein KF839_14735 [Nitrosomonas sp.]|nr:hypothetical protein [Nitrosomonas sp.]
MFFYDPSGQLIGEYQDKAATTTPADDWLVRQETVWLGNIPVGVITKRTATSEIQVHYIHADHLNTPRAIVDQSNTIVWRWENIHAFGANLPNEDPDNNGQLFEYHLRFPGQYFDKETGLHYNYFRYYEPETGRYISPDPIGLAAGMDVWGYGLQNPIRWIDPSGLDATNWWNNSGGRNPVTDGPTNGNWGGGNWSGGVGKGTGTAPALDSGDECYQRHDQCYDAGTPKALCDKKLVDELKALSSDPRRWTRPPAPGTEGDSDRYRRGAIIIFGQ